MKYVIAAFFFLLLSLVPSGEKCYAKDSPVVVIGGDVWLLDDKGERMFLLPETYYAPVVGIDEQYYTVSFNGVSGKILKNSVSVTGYGDEVPGTQQILHISEKFSYFTGLKMMSAPGQNGEETDMFVPVGEAFTYIGSYPFGEQIWYYVCYGEKYGYVLSDFCDRTVEIGPFVPMAEEPVEEEKQEETGLLKILVISGVAVTVVVLLIVLLIPKRGKKTRYYYET